MYFNVHCISLEQNVVVPGSCVVVPYSCVVVHGCGVVGSCEKSFVFVSSCVTCHAHHCFLIVAIVNMFFKQNQRNY